MKNITIKIKGMHCQSCEMLIKDALEEQEGVKSSEISNKNGTAKITFDESKISEAQLKSILKKEGYEVASK